LLILLAFGTAATVVGLATSSSLLLSISTPVFVIALAGMAAVVTGRVIRSAWNRLSTSRL
jgi:hypothetical protein